jgi:hypothetical protein
MPVKLHINIQQGAVDVEGDESFVQAVYEDLREQVRTQFGKLPERPETPVASSDQSGAAGPTGNARRRPARRTGKTGTPDGGKGRVADYKPSFNANLDLAKLPDFYSKLSMENHREKILAFTVFLRDEVGINPCSADDIYSCYFVLKSKTKIPTAFIQAIRDAQNKAGFVQFVSIAEVRVTTAGENHYQAMLSRKGAEQ